ncbi:UNVERIFIED_ORG: hypothetical protein ABIC97_002620 [Peribacillus simplex]
MPESIQVSLNLVHSRDFKSDYQKKVLVGYDTPCTWPLNVPFVIVARSSEQEITRVLR